MKFLLLVVFLVFLSTTRRLVHGSPYLKPFKGSEKENDSLRPLLQYYKLQGDNSGQKYSMEAESPEIDIQKKYRLEFSGDEISPYASYQFEEKPVIQQINESVIPSVIDEVELEVTTIYPSENITSTAKLDILKLADEAELNDNDSTGEENCVEGDLKKVDCNTCVCSDGSYFCSKMKCALIPKKGGGGSQYLEDSFMSHEALAQKKEEMINNMSLLNKKSWKKKTQSTTPLPDCSSGMTKSIDCNTCICAQQKWACTKRSCIALTFREKASYTDGSIMKQVDTLKENHHLDDDCLEEETKEIGCNFCVCHYNSWSCTNVSCNASNKPTAAPVKIAEIEEACQKEADVKSKDCNLCKCRRGVWVCALNDCQKIGDKTPESPESRSSVKFTRDKDI